MNKRYKNKSGYTLIIIIGVIGFLLVLLTGVFKIVLFELKDTKNMDYYVKSRIASEAGEELAMLKLKEKGFGYAGSESYDKEGKSIMLSENPLDGSLFKETKDVFFGYEIDSKADTYNGEIEEGGFQIIPLFYVEDNDKGDTKKPVFEITSGKVNKLSWNIIGEEGGVSGIGEFDYNSSTDFKIIVENGAERNFKIENISVENFLDKSELNYLTIFNVGNDIIKYSIKTDDSESFTKPITTVYSSAKIGEIKQNIKLTIDNSKYYDVLKYAIYEN